MEYWDIKNINFSLIEKDDSRKEEFDKQILERGFDDSETWSLRDTIANFIIPRLERYQEIANDFLIRDEELVQDIDLFLNSMKLVSKDRTWANDDIKEINEGLSKFPKIFMSLWW